MQEGGSALIDGLREHPAPLSMMYSNAEATEATTPSPAVVIARGRGDVGSGGAVERTLCDFILYPFFTAATTSSEVEVTG